MNELLNLSTTDIVAQAMQPGALGDAANDYAEVGLDQLTDMIFAGTIPNVLRELPVVKTIVALGRTGTNIYNAFRLKKQLVFLQTVNAGNPDPQGIAKRIKAAKENANWFRREVEQIAVYLERHTHEEKTKLQALIYLDYLSGLFTEEKYIEYLDILDQLFICDIPQIVEYYEFKRKREAVEEEMRKKTKVEKSDSFSTGVNVYGVVFESTRCTRLKAIGLLLETMYTHPGKIRSDYELSPQGEYFAGLAKTLGFHAIS